MMRRLTPKLRLWQEFVAASRPAVFRDSTHPAEWPAFAKWGGRGGIEHLKSVHGDTPVDVAVRSYMETLVIHKLSSRQFTRQNDLYL